MFFKKNANSLNGKVAGLLKSIEKIIRKECSENGSVYNYGCLVGSLVSLKKSLRLPGSKIPPPWQQCCILLLLLP